MKDVIELARIVQSREPEEVHQEIFDIIKNDKPMLAEIVHAYVESVVPDVVGIKNLVHAYHHPISLEEEVEKEAKIEEEK